MEELDEMNANATTADCLREYSNPSVNVSSSSNSNTNPNNPTAIPTNTKDLLDQVIQVTAELHANYPWIRTPLEKQQKLLEQTKTKVVEDDVTVAYLKKGVEDLTAECEWWYKKNSRRQERIRKEITFLSNWNRLNNHENPDELGLNFVPFDAESEFKVKAKEELRSQEEGAEAGENSTTTKVSSMNIDPNHENDDHSMSHFKPVNAVSKLKGKAKEFQQAELQLRKDKRKAVKNNTMATRANPVEIGRVYDILHAAESILEYLERPNIQIIDSRHPPPTADGTSEPPNELTRSYSISQGPDPDLSDGSPWDSWNTWDTEDEEEWDRQDQIRLQAQSQGQPEPELEPELEPDFMAFVSVEQRVREQEEEHALECLDADGDVDDGDGDEDMISSEMEKTAN